MTELDTTTVLRGLLSEMSGHDILLAAALITAWVLIGAALAVTTHGAADGPAIALAAFPRLASDLLSPPSRRPGLSGQALREPNGAAARVTDVPITPAGTHTISTTAALAWRPHRLGCGWNRPTLAGQCAQIDLSGAPWALMTRRSPLS